MSSERGKQTGGMGRRRRNPALDAPARKAQPAAPREAKGSPGAEETARQILNASRESLLLLDTEGRVVDCNDAAVWRLGGNRAGLIGASVFARLPKRLGAHRRARLKQVVRLKKPVHFMDQRAARWFDHKLQPVLDRDRKVVRIAQEAMTNVAKHARGAGRIRVSLGHRGERVSLSVADDGPGFDVRAARAKGSHAGWGLRVMEERAASVGGRVSVESRPGRGTTVAVGVKP